MRTAIRRTAPDEAPCQRHADPRGAAAAVPSHRGGGPLARAGRRGGRDDAIGPTIAVVVLVAVLWALTVGWKDATEVLRR